MWSVIFEKCVKLNAVVYVSKREGVCTFQTKTLIERLKIDPRERGTRVLDICVVEKYSGTSEVLWCILHKACV